MRKDFLWIRQCILSCTDTFQLNCCRTLISLFKEKYTDHQPVPALATDCQSLLDMVHEKETDIEQSAFSEL